MITLRGTQKLNREQLLALIDKIKAIVYARVSTDGQIDNYSIESQVERCVRDAKEKLQFNEEEILVLCEEGESGDNPDRPMINYALFLMGKGIGQVLLFLHPDRLSRDAYLQKQITREIWGMGCDVHFVEFNLQKDNPESMLGFGIQGEIAAYNKAKILANTKRGRLTKLANGKIPGIKRIYGYKYDKDIDLLVENPEEKEVYQKMVDMLIHQDMSCSEVARTLSKKYPAPSGSKWYQATISRMLRNPAYKGIFFYGKTEVVQAHGKKKVIQKPESEWFRIPIPSYIDEVTFHKLQLKLDGLSKSSKKSGRPSEEYLLKGLCKCGRCGAALSSGITSQVKYKKHKYYSCNRKTKKSYEVGTGNHNAICRGRNWRTDKVDQIVWDRVLKLIKNPEAILKEIVARQSDLSSLEALKKKKTELTKILNDKYASKDRYIDLYASGIIKTKHELESKLGNLQSEIDENESELRIIVSSIQNVSLENDQVKMFINMLDKFRNIVESDTIEMKDKKLLVNTVVEKVIFHDEGELEIILKFSGNHNTLSGSSSSRKKEHQNLITSQSECLDIYVSDQVALSKERSVSHKKYSNLLDDIEGYKHLYYNEHKTFEEIAELKNVDWWTIKNMFKDLGLKGISTKERGVINRKKQLPLILDLHHKQKLTLTEIYSKHGLSQAFVRQALKENGYEVVNYQHQK